MTLGECFIVACVQQSLNRVPTGLQTVHFFLCKLVNSEFIQEKERPTSLLLWLVLSEVFCKFKLLDGSVVEWLKHRTDNQHGLGSKPTCTILLCPWKRHFTAPFPAWWFWQAVLNYSNISTKLLEDSNILVSPEAGRDNCLPYV